MPVMRCQANGKPGYKWGESGKCYTGPGAKAQAQRQGRAIEANKHAIESNMVRDILVGMIEDLDNGDIPDDSH